MGQEEIPFCSDTQTICDPSQIIILKDSTQAVRDSL